ncbi:MAG: lipid II flippase MurJ, partial [Atopobiaceae bacterium]|nr:lipid II flippase MurJ [Atopobiaceae bacterium]
MIHQPKHQKGQRPTDVAPACQDPVPEDPDTSLASPEGDEVQADRPSEGAAGDEVGRSAAMMGALVIVSRLTGFLRTWGQAFALGTTLLSSCYTVASNLPNQLYELVMGGLLATSFLPVYLSCKERSGRKSANAYASNLLSIVLLLMGALSVLGIVFAVQFIWTQSFTASSTFDADRAVYFFRFFAIEIVLYGLSAVVSGILNAERDYFWSNAAPIINNVVCTA